MSDPERGSPDTPDSPHEYNTSAPTATVSSLKSDHSTEQLICKTPEKNTKKPKQVKEQSVTSKSVEAGSEDDGGKRRLVVVLGLAQVVLGALLVGAGAGAVVKGAALARVGAGLWAGCVAVVAGVVGVLAGINDCYGLYGASTATATRSPLLTAFLALSLLCLACGNSAAVLAATGLQRDSARSQPAPNASFEDEMQAWTPVLTNIAVLIIASVHCLVCVVSIYHLSKRVCPCFRRKQPFDHNQFDPGFKGTTTFAVHVDEKVQNKERIRNHELCKDLEIKLQGDTLKKKKMEPEFGSATSKERLVTRWLGRHQPAAPAPAAPAPVPTASGTARRRSAGGVGMRKQRPHPAPLMLLPAHHASTLGRMPAGCVMVPPAAAAAPAPAPRYSTLPLPPPHIYYHMHDNRMRRRRSPRALATSEQRRRGREARNRERDSQQLARSLERIHRKRRTKPEHPTDADLKQTYTGLDRAYAEQFIAVIDETRHAHAHAHTLAAGPSTSLHDSLTSATTSDSQPSQGEH